MKRKCQKYSLDIGKDKEKSPHHQNPWGPYIMNITGEIIKINYNVELN